VQTKNRFIVFNSNTKNCWGVGGLPPLLSHL
jgi:hypothetical protein